MHIYFSGIGGAGIGPLALVAQQAGFTVSGSDKQDSQYITYLKKHGINQIHIGQTKEDMAAIHQRQPIDWFVYSSAVSKEQTNHPELLFAKEAGIKISKRDELINLILEQKELRMIAIAGTHGKTTTTAMVIWLMQRCNVPISYAVGAKISFGDMGHYTPGSKYFIYEADEFDRNFLAFHPYLSLLSGVTWDHHEIFPTREDYKQAFRDFISQTKWTLLWQEEFDYLSLEPGKQFSVEQPENPQIKKIALAGHYNRLDAWLAIRAVHELTKTPIATLIEQINEFPGSQRRMEELVPNLYSDYAHTPDKIRGGMSMALEMAAAKKQKLVVVYEPLTNRRQHYMMDDYKDCFNGADKLYWVPSYLAREDPHQRVIPPSELITHLSDPSIATPMEMDDKLQETIQTHLQDGDMVVAMTGGGGGSLDEWLREKF
jgi:UDP-N-acetylmuramate--alanine ligase